MAAMFYNARAFNQNIGNWNVSKVVNITGQNPNGVMNGMNFMFQNATIFNNGEAPGGITQKMNWTVSFSGIPTDFSTSSELTNQNKPNPNW